MGSPSLLYFLVFLLFVSESSQGIRVDEGLKPCLEKKSHGHESSLSLGSMDTPSDIILCNHGLFAGNQRTLTSFTAISPLVFPKKKNQNEEETPKPPHVDVAAGIAEMDYSPARRKTPIHN